jgi:hypothetical protein
MSREIWKGVKTSEKFPKPPSLSASYSHSRSEGGKLAAIQSVARPDFIGLKVTKCGSIQEFRGLRLTPEEAKEIYLRSSARRKSRVEMILEPLKARPITAGDSLGCYLSMIGQKQMWNHLRSKKQCTLIGEPLTVDHLKWLQIWSNPAFEYWVSGDYSAATDNLNIFQTKAIFEEFLELSTYDDDLKLIMREILYEQELWYKNHDDSRVMQTNGQLMGSPLSFPVLNVANLIAYWKAYERFSGKKFHFSELPVLVNGDDILFKASPEFYSIWQQEVKKFGFDLSVGKSYFSKDFLTVNSKLYEVRKTHRRLTTEYKFQLVTFFNPSQVLPGEEKKTDFVDLLSDALMRTSDPRFTLGLFLHFCRNEVRQATRNGLFNLFGHKYSGTLGVQCPESFKPRWTSKQLRLARFLWRNPGKPIRELSKSSVSKGFLNLCCDSFWAFNPDTEEEDTTFECKFSDHLNHTCSSYKKRYWKTRSIKVPKTEPKMNSKYMFSNPWKRIPYENLKTRLISFSESTKIPIGTFSSFDKKIGIENEVLDKVLGTPYLRFHEHSLFQFLEHSS